jgi:hypothetical protein
VARTTKTGSGRRDAAAPDDPEAQATDPAPILPETPERLPEQADDPSPDRPAEDSPVADSLAGADTVPAAEFSAADSMQPGTDVPILSEPAPDLPTDPELGRSAEPDGTSTAAASALPADQTPAQPTAAPPAPQKSGGFAAGLVGGALVALLAGGALYAVNPSILQGGATAQDDLAPLTTELSAQAARLETLTAEVAALTADLAALRDTPPPVADTSALEDRISALEARPETPAVSDAALADLAARLETLESRPADAEQQVEQATQDILTSIADQRAELERLARETQARLAEAEAQAEALRAAGAEAEAAATARAAMARVEAALNLGGPFADALAEVQEITGTPVPPLLLELAAEGAPTLADLRAAFPDAARSALAASRQVALPEEATTMERLTAFLQAQTGARSLAPREGDGPDAVLSRAGAALDAGNLQAALTEMDALPEPGQVAMADWRRLADIRLAASAAAAELSATLGE